MKGDFKKFQEQDRRLCILLSLESAAAYTANHFLLTQYLDSMAHAVSHDVVKADLAWLEEQGLLNTSIQDELVKAQLTTRGVDVANGRATVPGVKRPNPGE